jgi:hypothetical protein
MMHPPCVHHTNELGGCVGAYIAKDCLSELLSLAVVACLVTKQLQAALASMSWQLYVTWVAQKTVCCWCGC